MPLNSVQQYVLGLVDGVRAIGITTPTQAYIKPEIYADAASAPQVYVWAAAMHESRKAMTSARPGYKKLLWRVSIWVHYIEDANAQNGYTDFPNLIDTLMEALRSTPLPAAITDSISGTS